MRLIRENWPVQPLNRKRGRMLVWFRLPNAMASAPLLMRLSRSRMASAGAPIVQQSAAIGRLVDQIERFDVANWAPERDGGGRPEFIGDFQDELCSARPKSSAVRATCETA